jgi:hypothetical protein
VAAVAVAGCGARSSPARSPLAGIPRALLAEARPIGVGPRFRPPVRGRVLGGCRRDLGRRDGVHLEVFGANRVVIVAPGIGTRPPRRSAQGRIVAARCYGDPVTLEPTGIVLVRPREALTLRSLFREWGQPLSARRLASFRGPVSVYLDGRRWRGAPNAVPLRRHAEIVLEVGPHVPPHRSFTFPPGL